MIQKIRNYLVPVTAAATSLVSTAAFAASDTDVDAMFSAVDLSALKTQTSTLLIATLLIPLVFVAARLVKKAIRSAAS